MLNPKIILTFNAHVWTLLFYSFKIPTRRPLADWVNVIVIDSRWQTSYREKIQYYYQLYYCACPQYYGNTSFVILYIPKQYASGHPVDGVKKYTEYPVHAFILMSYILSQTENVPRKQAVLLTMPSAGTGIPP